MESSTEEQRPPTPEEIKAHQEKLKTYYREQISYLKVEHEYQTHVTEIEELRMRYVRAQIMIANAMAPPPPEASEEDPEPKANVQNITPRDESGTIVPAHDRKLKKEHA